MPHQQQQQPKQLPHHADELSHSSQSSSSFIYSSRCSASSSASKLPVLLRRHFFPTMPMLYYLTVIHFALLSTKALAQQLLAGGGAPEGTIATNCAQFPDEPMCQQQQFPQQQKQMPFCNYQDLWLIPGKADASCTRPNPRKLVQLDAKQVRIHPAVVKFPGCFTVEIRNVHIMDGEGLPSSIFAKTEYQWLNVRGSENAKCQNASVDGCGGFGNNCYYCDICDSLKRVDAQPDQSGLPTGIAEQLQGMNCPTEPGYYTFRKQFCFNDWRWLDADGDCRLDLAGGAADDQSGLRAAMAALQQVGYGTVVAKVRLAYNATPEIARKKALKEAQIERNALHELQQQQQQRQGNWRGEGGSSNGVGPTASSPSDEFRRWFVAQRKGQWHRDEYLPWLLYENEVACIRLTFDVCERAPQQRWDGSGGYTCI